MATRIKEDVMNKINCKNTKRARHPLRTALLIAAAVLALGGSALAVHLGTMRVRNVTGETQQGSYVNEWGRKVNVAFSHAQLELSFEVEGESREVLLKPGWLPSEPNWSDMDEEGCGRVISDQGEGSVLPYVLWIFNGAELRDTRYYFNGEPEMVTEDEWLGWQRTEFTVDYTKTIPGAWEKANYLLLFSPEDNYLLYLAGTSDFETLEKIAADCEIKVTQEPATDENNMDFSFLDLGRG